MKIEAAELYHLKIPLVGAFRTSFGTENFKNTFLLRLITSEAEGWAECAADLDPLYSSEFLAGAEIVLTDHLLPRLVSFGPDLGASDVQPTLEPITGHHMAKHVVETALLDAELRAQNVSLRRHLGGQRTRVPAGVSIGIKDNISQLLDSVEEYLGEGYVRIKLKIEPGWDVEAVRAVRKQFGDELMLQVDANAAYRLNDTASLAALDEFGLLLIEQPLPEDDIRGHAELARRIRTPICLDESIRSARDAATAIALRACEVINIKPARVGGYYEARRIHDVCAAHGIPVWCGGMLETGVGRAANLALASLPNFVLPGDVSASRRYFAQDITEPFELEQGTVRVPDGPGIGVTPLADALAQFVTRTTYLDFNQS
jgi:o-succinylbenzoate synthase